MGKHSHSGGEFMGLAGAVGITGAFGLPLPARDLPGRDADLVVFNAKVFTVDLRAPKAEAFAVKAGSMFLSIRRIGPYRNC